MRPAFVLATLLILGAGPLQAGEPLRSITVTARSEIDVVPDEVVIDFTIDCVKDRLVDAKVENDTLTTAAMEVIQAHDIAKADVKITEMDLGRRYDDYRDKFLGYGFKRSFEVRLTDFRQVEPLVSRLIEAGVPQIDAVDYRLRSQREGQFEARALAVEYAKEKASHLASLLDMKIGRAIHVKEDVEYNWDTGGLGGMGGSVHNSTRLDPLEFVDSQARDENSRFVMFQEEGEAPKAGEQDAANLLLAPGLIQLNAVVTIEFELEPIE